MRVTLCVDALQPQLTGIGRYTWNLWQGLRRQTDVSELLAYRGGIFLDDPRMLLEIRRLPRNIRLKRWTQWGRVRRTLRSTVVHAPNYFLPEMAETGVITVHDLSVFNFPAAHPRERVETFERLFTSSLSRAVAVITDTETVRRELCDMFSLPPRVVTAVPLGVDRSFYGRDKAAMEAAMSRLALTPGAYGLSVAAFEPRKKIKELIDAWGRLPHPLRTRHPLVLAGSIGWRNEDLHQRIAEAASEGWLRHLGFVDDVTLQQLYAGARLFVYPSIYEGFGLPPVEAMASGTPVVVSNRSCLPEVCGDAARYVDPDDRASFTLILEECLTDEQLRAHLRARGFETAKKYSWERCVADTVAVYRKALTPLA